VFSVAFSPDGERIVTAAWGDKRAKAIEVKVWDARTGTAVFEPDGVPESPNLVSESIVFSLGGTRLAAGRDNTARLWDVRTGKLQCELKHTSPVVHMALSPDGARFATVSADGTGKVWDAETGKPQWKFKGSGQGITIRVAFSPDGTRLFTGFPANKTAKVWDAGTGKPLLDLTGYTDNLRFAFSPDGKRIVTGGDKGIKVWDAEKGGPPLLELMGITGVAGCVSFSPDSMRIVSGSNEGNTANVWDAKSGVPLLGLKGWPGPATMGFVPGAPAVGERGASFSPDGTRIVSVGGWLGAYEATVWDARTGAELLALTGHTNIVSCVAFSPDGTRIVTGSQDGTAKVWDAETGTPRVEMKLHSGQLDSVALSPDGTRIVSGRREFNKPSQATVWDARTGTALLELKGIKGVVQSVAFSRDGRRIVTGGYFGPYPTEKGTVTVWDARTGAALLELKGFKRPVHSVAFGLGGTRIVTAGGLEGRPGLELKVWDATSGAVLFDLKPPPRGLGGGTDLRGGSVAISPDGTRFVAGGFQGSEAAVWDTGTGATLFELKGHTGTLQCLAFSPDGTRIVTGGGDRDRRALLWDATTGTALPIELTGHTSAVLCVAFSPDGTRIVTGSVDRTVRVWDAKTGTALLELKGFKTRVISVAFAPDGNHLVTGELGRVTGEVGTITVWDAPAQKTPLLLKGHTAPAQYVAFSPDGTRMVTGGLNELKVWDARTGAFLLDLKGHESRVTSVVFSPDGTRIVSGGVQPGVATVWDAQTGAPQRELNWDAQTGKVWDARTGAPLIELKGPPGTLISALFSPDGMRLVTRGRDGEKVWDAGTGKELPGEAIPNPVANARISPDGRLFASMDVFTGRRVELIPLQPDEEELAYRRLHTQPNVRRYRDGYLAAGAAKDNCAACFYLDRLIEFYTATNQPDEAKKWRAVRVKYSEVAPPPREKK
jgi:WD40 repeat protein